MSSPASKDDIKLFEKLSGFILPADYVDFLRKSNGGEGFIGENAYLILWPVEQLLEMNSAYQTQEYAPGLLLIGSDGGGEAIAFDTNSPEFPVVSVPFVGMDRSLIRFVSPNFGGVFEALIKS